MPATVLVVGETGTGKSSLLNTILKKKIFTVSDEADACTKDPEQHFAVINGHKIIGIDTEGFNDGTNRQDDQNKKLINFLKEYHDGINTIAFVIHHSEKRLTEYLQNLIRFMYDLFGTANFFSNICFIFTHSYVPIELKSEEFKNKLVQFMKSLQNNIGVSQFPMFYIDNKNHQNHAICEQINKLRSFIISREKSPIHSKDWDAKYGYKIDTKTKDIYVDTVRIGDYLYKKYNTYEIVTHIPNNGAAPSEKNRKLIDTKKVKIKKYDTEYRSHIFDRDVYEGDKWYKIYYDQRKTNETDLRTYRTKYGNWENIIYTEKKEHYRTRPASYYDYRYVKNCRELGGYYEWTEKRERRLITFDFYGNPSYGSWSYDGIIREWKEKRNTGGCLLI